GIVADSGRSDAPGAVERDRGRFVHHQQYICASAGDVESSAAGDVPPEPEPELLDAGLQPGSGREEPAKQRKNRLSDCEYGDEPGYSRYDRGFDDTQCDVGSADAGKEPP